jgi:hypothetical protein
MVEVVQRRAARWARGAYGIISVTVTALLRDLGWLKSNGPAAESETLPVL